MYTSVKHRHLEADEESAVPFSSSKATAIEAGVCAAESVSPCAAGAIRADDGRPT